MMFPKMIDTADEWSRGHECIQTLDNQINTALRYLAREKHEKEKDRYTQAYSCLMSLNQSYPVDSIAVPSEPLKISGIAPS